MCRHHVSSLFWGALEMFVLLTCVQGGGQFSLRLLSYRHPSGQLIDGHCCDSMTSSPCDPSHCDPYFVVRVTEPTGNSAGVNMSFQTGVSQQTGFINFTETTGKPWSTLNGSFPYWPGAVEVTIDVKNAGDSGPSNSDGYITSFRFIHTRRMSTNNETIYTPVEPLTAGRTQILAEINVKCDEGCRYDVYCYKCCVPMDNTTGHVTCDQYGDVHCLPGWTGNPASGCLEPICNPPCSRHSTCQVMQGQHMCVCDQGFTGPSCEKHTTTTPATTALPGSRSTITVRGPGASSAGTGLPTAAQGSSTLSSVQGQAGGAVTASASAGAGSGIAGAGNGNTGGGNESGRTTGKGSGDAGSGNGGGGGGGSGNAAGNGNTAVGNGSGSGNVHTTGVEAMAPGKKEEEGAEITMVEGEFEIIMINDLLFGQEKAGSKLQNWWNMKTKRK